MTGIIEKRRSLHNLLAAQQEHNDLLKSQISQLQALANVGKAVSMTAHEINNLLTPLASYAQLALNNPQDKALTEKVIRKTVKNAERASKILESMIAMINGEKLQRRNCQLRLLVEDIFSCICRDFSRDRITVDIQIPPDLTVWAVPVQIQQVLMNLILNAYQAMSPTAGILTIKAQDTVDAVCIEVNDTGSGIEPADLPKIFELFFTTKSQNSSSQHQGSGLGLAFCREIIESHDGFISVESEPNKATTFRLILPKSQEA